MRQSLGTAVFSGMIGVTFFGIFLTPVFFFALVWLAERRHPKAEPPHDKSVTAREPPAPRDG
jgi:HAE1 family hydrophobic/amphiphilic exporter-1